MKLKFLFLILIFLITIVPIYASELGCCINDQGICQSRSLEGDCLGGVWLEDEELCSIQECQKGCCMMAGQPLFTTELNCEILGEEYQTEFSSGGSEYECASTSLADEEGACVYESGNILHRERKCQFTTIQDCISKTGSESNFYGGVYCSNTTLNTTCTAHDSDGCIVGKDDVYWFDSCGNKEEIKNECNVFAGTRCGIYRVGIDENAPSQGEYICRDLSCKVNITGVQVVKQHGESWCEYEGKIGIDEGKKSSTTGYYARAVVGSNHWRHYCFNSEEQVEPCDNFRSGMCVQENSMVNGSEVSNAKCIANDWENCIALNYVDSAKDRLDECKKQSNCFVKNGYLFNLCLPKYPAGFDLDSDTSKETATKICDMASFTCIMVYVKTMRGWKCKVNCDCDEAWFAQQSNEFCISLGDCGGYINVLGKYNGEGYSVLGGSKSSEKYENDNNTVFGNYIPAINISSKKFNQEGDLAQVGSYSGDVSKTKWYNPMYIFKLILGWGKTKKKYVNFDCMPWQAPDGGADCEKCLQAGDSMHSCSKYRCQSLGKNCEFINEETGHELCVKVDQGDSASPIINFGDYGGDNLPEGISYTLLPNGIHISDDSNELGCLKQFTEINLSFKTNEPSICKISDALAEKPSDFETFEGEYFGDNSFLSYEHNMLITLPSIHSLQDRYFVDEDDAGAIIPTEYGNLNYYVMCKDNSGNYNLNSYVFNLCLEPGPDLKAPFIKKFLPSLDRFVAYGLNSFNLTFWTDEPADCRWSHEDKNYSSMENNFNCLNDYDAKELFGWRCAEELTGIENETQNVYIRCKDKPWLDENNDTRNENHESRVYTLKKSISPLSIKEIKPENGKEIVVAESPTNINLRVSTIGGAENGKSDCSFRILGNNLFTDFLNTSSSFHAQPSLQFEAGDHTIEIFCQDAAGNIAENTTNFEIDVDTFGPRIIRYYKSSGLKIITNEPGECRYTFNKRFKWENATSAGGSKEHSLEWKYSTYLIQCEDEFGNKGPLIKIKPYITEVQ